VSSTGRTTLAYRPVYRWSDHPGRVFAPSLIICAGVRHFGISRALVSGGGDVARRWLFRWRAANRGCRLGRSRRARVGQRHWEDLPWFGAHPGLPGSITYPVTPAGGFFIVVVAGVLLFDERLGPFGASSLALRQLSWSAFSRVSLARQGTGGELGAPKKISVF
jgi:hypothetical protein